MAPTSTADWLLNFKLDRKIFTIKKWLKDDQKFIQFAISEFKMGERDPEWDMRS
ncbi:MAG: hypothetical protein LBB05_03365 [Puniceicoccales bacterium]|jgi:hypothetical protein|nr:hypothetical protein [Puniceicoccales bacterium]